MEVLKTVLIVIAVVVSLFWVLGFWAICSYNSKNTLIKGDTINFDGLSDEELTLVFSAIKHELYIRGVIKENPFEDLE